MWSSAMRYVLAIAVFMAAMAFDQRPVRDYGDQPWCSAVVFDHSVVKNRQYRLPEILGGNRGFCEQNPDWYGRVREVEAPKRHRKPRVNRD